MDALEKISAEDRALIRRSWAVLNKHINDTAYAIFEMIFRQSPDTKQLFPFMKIHEMGGKRSREMEFHGLRFMQVLESVVNALDNPGSLDPLCDNLGRVHGRLAEQRGFRTHHWSVFIECTLYHFRLVLEQENYFHGVLICDRVIMLWRGILRTLIKRMKLGFNKDIRNRMASRELDSEVIEILASEASSEASSSEALSHSFSLPLISMQQSTPKRESGGGFLAPIKLFTRRKMQRNHQK